jgi:phosphoribosylformylglycinamidine synthase
MWAFSEVIDGITEACQAFETPITGGNVSFYNETEGQGVYPTPVLGMVGLIEDMKHLATCGFKGNDEVILLLGKTHEDLGGSEYLAEIHKQIIGEPPRLDLENEKAIQQFCLKLIKNGLVSSAHDVSDGGLLIALAECCLAAQNNLILGADIELNSSSAAFANNISLAASLFGESQSRIIISIKQDKLETVESLAKEDNILCTKIGNTSGEDFVVRLNGHEIIRKPVKEMHKSWQMSLENLLENAISSD